jgi:hypothetical protein
MRRRNTETASDTADQARTRARWYDLRAAWLKRLETDEPQAIAGASRADKKTIKALYEQARECWGSEPPDGWAPPEQPVEISPFHTVLAMNSALHGGRHRPQEYRAGERMPDGRIVGQDQTETITVDVAIDHARVLLAACERESSPPAPPEPEPERAPPMKFTPEGVVSALLMPGGVLSPINYAAGERDPRQVGALGQHEAD